MPEKTPSQMATAPNRESIMRLAAEDVDDSDLLNQAIVLHYNDIVAAVARRGHCRGSARDIVHDLYLKISDNPEVLRGKRSPGSFLARAATNLAIDRFRRQNFEARLFTAADGIVETLPAEMPGPDQRLETEARLRSLRSAIAELPPRRKAVFILHRLHGFSADEISTKLNISRNMVDRHLRKSLIHCLNRLEDEAD
ncbi:RNA polymerase sigma factor [Alloyangia mangrovi]|uniref:RNA polymerase sigma factor n=1 Tax=Alloyangia mangrovi TaxID=1779329 RepID=UPI0021A5FBE4|nr:RNA polymerase sigma factor [Alloyangia mangrovi]